MHRVRVRLLVASLAAIALSLLASSAGAQSAPATSCPEGQRIDADTAGHCCWAAQVWSASRSRCIGTPQCPGSMVANGEECVAATCANGQSIGPDTAGHCCWPGQVWSAGRSTCVGVPTCPTGLSAQGETCTATCPDGQVRNEDTHDHCCWSGQVWSSTRETCVGIPTCPDGMATVGDRCEAAPRVAPPVSPVPAPSAAVSPPPASSTVATAPVEDDPVLAARRAQTPSTAAQGHRPSTALLWAGVIALAVTWIPSPILSLTSNHDYPNASGTMWIPIVGPYVARSMMSPMGQSSAVGVGLLIDGIAQSLALATTAVGVIVAIVTSRPPHETPPAARQARREITVLPWASANPTEGARAGVTVVW